LRPAVAADLRAAVTGRSSGLLPGPLSGPLSGPLLHSPALSHELPFSEGSLLALLLKGLGLLTLTVTLYHFIKSHT
jgi:hypothetical protein